MENITIKDIARICGVGVSTVSRAINNHPDINADTKKLVMDTIREYNYVPNNSARNLKRSESRSIAVLVKGISNPFFSKMIRVIERGTYEKGYSMVLQHVDEHSDEVDVALQLIKEKRLKGIIFLGGYFSHTQEELDQLTVPCVLSTVGRIKPEDVSDNGLFSVVCVDDYKESYKLVDYLCSIGHKRIAIIAADESDKSIGQLRLRGYKKALEDHHIPVDEELIQRMPEGVDTYSMEAGYIAAGDLIRSGKDFTALYAISDAMAVGACKAFRDAGKSIPEDCSIAGFDGLDYAAFYNPSMTTIQQPVEDMAKATLKILFDMIKRRKKCIQQVFEARLFIGGSTAAVQMQKAGDLQ